MEYLSQAPIPVRIIIIGTSKTGKTSFMKRWTKNIFPKKYEETVQFQSELRTYEDKEENKYYRVEIMEIVCKEEYESLTKILVKEAKGMILLADVSYPDSRTE